MGFLDLFRKKEVKVPEVVTTDKPYLSIKCELCGQDIGTEKWKKVRGQLVHRSCFKRQVKLAGF